MAGGRTALMAACAAAFAAAVWVAAMGACSTPQRPDGGRGLLDVGVVAPSLSGVDQDGKSRTIAEAHGKYLLVFFYPKDGTPGCTAEACAFRDAWDSYRASDVMIYGVSADDQASHKEFAAEHQLGFPLIADDQGSWQAAFGVSSFLGMAQRVSFLVGPDGRIVARYPDVDPGVHATQVLAEVGKLRGE